MGAAEHQNLTGFDTQDLDALIKLQRSKFRAEGEVTYATRIDRLKRLKALILENKVEFANTTKREFNGARSYEFSLFSEFGSKVEAIDYSIKHLKEWMKPEKRKTNKPMNFLGGKGQVRHFPKGVVGIISPWNLPFGLTVAPLTSALAAGNRALLKPSEFVPETAALFAEVVPKYFSKDEVAVVTGGAEISQKFAELPFDHLLFTGSTRVGAQIMQAASKNLVPGTLELGGKSPNIFFADVMDQGEDFISKAVEGLVLGFLNQGEVCTCPSRALIHEDMYEPFMEMVIERAKKITRGNPLDVNTMVGAQASREQFDKIMSYLQIGREEGAEILIGGDIEQVEGLGGGFYIQPTFFKGDNKMRVFQEEIFGPVIGITTFKTEEEALAIANDTEYGLGAGVWTRDTNKAYRMARGIQAGRIWMNCYHAYPSHAAFGGYKKSGIGREGHKVTLDHYQQKKNLLVSYGDSPLGFF